MYFFFLIQRIHYSKKQKFIKKFLYLAVVLAAVVLATGPKVNRITAAMAFKVYNIYLL